jgi:hypothetical protein
MAIPVVVGAMAHVFPRYLARRLVRVVNADPVHMHITLAVVTREVNRPAAARGEIDQEKEGILLRNGRRFVVAHLGVIAEVSRDVRHDTDAIGMECLMPGRGNSFLRWRSGVAQALIIVVGQLFHCLALVPSVWRDLVTVLEVRVAGSFPP